MKKFLLRATLCAALIASPGLPRAWAAPLDSSVVKVFATVRYPAPFSPWTKQAPQDISGSGVVIGGDRIITNAHVVLYASDIEVQATEAGDKVPATVEAIAPGIDLAVLKLDDPSFFKKHPPIARANVLPHIKDPVLVYGFPIGGNTLSITKGIVSRIEYVPYNYPTSGLRIQIDAAINPGNSGGPAVAGGKMIGLAFSRLVGADAQNIGYIIPDEEIELFLKGIATGHYAGKPALYDDLQTLENQGLRRYLGVPESTTGVVVLEPYDPLGGNPLEKWDVITHISDTPIDDQGMIDLNADVRLNFEYLVQKDVRDGKVPLTIFRHGAVLHVEEPVAYDRPQLIPRLQGQYPSYFIYGPIVFSVASSGMLAGIQSKAPLLAMLSYVGSPLVTQRGNAPSPQRQDLVVIAAPFFPNPLVEGYGNHTGSVVYAVNGTRIVSLAQLVAVLRDLKSEYVTIDFDGRSIESLVFPRAALTAATNEILTDNGIRAQASPDMLAIWQGSAGK
jgi:S1-C subfamily serine protease